MDSLRRLTYCTNVHPAHSLEDVRAMLSGPVREVAQRSAPEQPFNVGLRLSAQAARELRDQGERERLSEELSSSGLFVTTLNGFPYGPFHGAPVKENVYRPDWQEPSRKQYTLALAATLEALLPVNETGSISTVPGCFGARATGDAAARMTRALLEVTSELIAIHRRSGRHITLALEPEPSCFLETAAETIVFFEQHVFRNDSIAYLEQLTGSTRADAERALRQHLGVCLDTCHASVEHEHPLDAFRAFVAAGIAIGKVQISCGLVLGEPSPENLEALRRFDEPIYLHQVVVRDGDELRRHVDLGVAFAREAGRTGQWRVHFHVPVFEADLSPFESTQSELAEMLAALAAERAELQLEVETYTWDVLPKALRRRSLVEAISEELAWTRRQWA